ncbi:hypothetical protein BGZ63DRAFT_395170 [Mariannaea sp. PMI_226]|nr:hypothetical protein BGZ63DRAFT_395170 [Mariannaea sp. PMI_226]
MMSKWSSRPADHNAIRQRNNQRRHRQRVKGRIEELEAQVAETKLQLSQALARIEGLSRELEEARATHNSMPPETHKTSTDISPTSKNSADEPLKRRNSCQSTSVQDSPNYSGSQSDRAVVQLGRDIPNMQCPLAPSQTIAISISTYNRSPILSAPWTSDMTMQAPTLDYEILTESDNQDCCDLSLPSPRKSTTRCQDAYLTITQQNYKGLDNSVIREWLEPGFRRPISQGDGCRVDTDLLFTLLDFISSP